MVNKFTWHIFLCCFVSLIRNSRRIPITCIISTHFCTHFKILFKSQNSIQTYTSDFELIRSQFYSFPLILPIYWNSWFRFFLFFCDEKMTVTGRERFDMLNWINWNEPTQNVFSYIWRTNSNRLNPLHLDLPSYPWFTCGVLAIGLLFSFPSRTVNKHWWIQMYCDSVWTIHTRSVGE